MSAWRIAFLGENYLHLVIGKLEALEADAGRGSKVLCLRCLANFLLSPAELS
jgi:hypothetical protein